MIRPSLTRLHAFFSQQTIRQRLERILLAVPVCLALLVAACGTAPKSPPAASREEMEDFQQIMQDYSRKTGGYLEKTQKGKNISELTLGWFIYDVLTELSSQDDGLDNYFNKDNGNLQVYLKTRFHDHPQSEIATLDSLAKQGHPTWRLSARYALETLRHIPDSSEPEETQSRDRRDLAGALATLRDLLEKSAREVVLPPS